MKRISHKILTALLMLLPLAWQSCADDEYLDTPTIPEFQGIGVNIPYIAPDAELSDKTRAALTRAGQPEDFVGGEADINDLYIFAFANGKNGESNAVKLSKNEVAALTASTEHPGFKCYPFELEVGEYHVYLVANVDLGSNFDKKSEKEVKEYSFASKCGAISEFENGIPMSCGASEVVSKDKKTDDYIPVKTKAATHISASLRFTVSKVLVSVVNDISDNYSITDATVKEIADKLNLFADSDLADPTVTAGEKSVLSLGSYYALPAMVNNKYPIDNLGNAITDHSGKWVFQVTFYVPERRTANTTKMHLGFTGGATKDFPLGLQENGSSTLKRSKFYRYQLTPAAGSASLVVRDWTPETILATLGGPVTLEVDKTDLGTISGENPGQIAYSSNVAVSYTSPTYTVNGKELDIFILTPATVNGKNVFDVKVNPELGILDKNALSDKAYFYLTAGPLKKKILANPDLSPYLTVTPENYTVVMKEISNEVEYSVEYTYATNLATLKYLIKEGSVDNAKTDLLYYMGGNQTTEVRPGSETNLGQSGRIVVKFVEPYNPEKFQKESNITYHYMASSSGKLLEADVTLKIVPNLNGYRLWFRDVGDKWNNPHVYIYQPLDYIHNGQILAAKTWYSGQQEDALLYSFTGKRQFKGWSNFSVPPGSIKPNDGIVDWDKLSVYDDNYYYTNDFISNFRTGIKDCDACKNGNNEVRWPGVKMIKVTESGHPQEGWWYIDLPAICTPGKALIMFTNAHSGKGEDMGRDSRYPLHMVPGIPLYDYDDHEGWLKYDVNDPNPQFVDDQPDMTPYQGAKEYRIQWPKQTDHYQIKIINADDNSVIQDFTDYSGYNNETGIFYYKYEPAEGERFKLAFKKGDGSVAYPESNPDKVYTKSDYDTSCTLAIPSIGTSGSTSTTYRIQWPKTGNFWSIKIINADNNQVVTDWVGAKADDTNQIFYYEGFTLPTGLNFKLEFKDRDNDSNPIGYPESNPDKVYTLSDFDQSKTLAIPSIGTSGGGETIEYDYWIKGSMLNNWKDESNVQMTKQSDGTYKWSGQLNSGTFGIRAMKDNQQKQWIYGQKNNSDISYTAANTCVIENSDNGSNFNLKDSGTFTFVFNPSALTLTVTKSSTPVGEKYRIYWNKTLETNDKDYKIVNINNSDYTQSGSDGKYYYYEFDSSKFDSSNKVAFFFKTESGDMYYINMSNEKWSKTKDNFKDSDGIKCFTVYKGGYDSEGKVL